MPLWLLAGLSWLVDKLGSRAAAIAVATAGIALMIAAGMAIVTAYVVPHVVMPAVVYQVFSVAAPTDWAGQLGALMGIKSISMAHRASMYLLNTAAK